MKRIAFFIIVLGICAVCSAGTIDVTITSLNGQAITPTKEITISSSDSINFRIMFNAPNTEYLFAIQSYINISGPGTLDWSHFSIGTWDEEHTLFYYEDLRPVYDPELHILGQEYGKSFIIDAPFNQGQRGTGSETWIVKDIWLHCEGPGDVQVWLSDRKTGNWGSIVVDYNYNPLPFTYGAGVIIHQIPEPMTLMLLGLGSLFVLRRKNKNKMILNL